MNNNFYDEDGCCRYCGVIFPTETEFDLHDCEENGYIDPYDNKISAKK